MLSEEDNELITNTDRGAPMGELFRRFWLPVALAPEFPGPDGAPIRLRVMGEDLIAFRDSDGRAGLIEAYCAHRGAPLFFGRNEECGLRCIYHGWKYDVEGNCVDLPNTPEGETFKEKIKLTSYAIVEAGDLVWAYMGHATASRRSRASPGLPCRARIATSRDTSSNATISRLWRATSTRRTPASSTALWTTTSAAQAMSCVAPTTTSCGR